MRLRKMIRSRSRELMEFRKGWVAAGLPQYPYNRVIKSYLRELKWPSASTVTVEVGSESKTTTGVLGTLKRALAAVRSKLRWSVKTAGALALLSALLILPSCALTTTNPKCFETKCGDVCCDSDGKVCPVCWEE